MSGRVIHEYVNRVVFQTTGRHNVRGARRDVRGVQQAVGELDAKLLAAGFAFQQFAKNAIQSFGEIESALSKFASRAGWELGRFRKETEQTTHDIARLTGVKHALILQAVQEGISQGSLQGMKVPEILEMVRDASKLHAAGQTDVLSAVSSAITSRQYGAPTAPWGMRLIYSASQVGAGNPAEYGKEYKDIAPGLNFLNVEQSEGLGALALIAGAAPSLAEGATWIKALLRTISNPQDDARAMFEERTGLTFTELQNMFSERGGMVKALTLLAETFHGPEIVGFFGRQEAAQGFAALTKVPGQLLRLQQAVRQNAVDDPIERAWGDNVDVWRITVERFARSMDTFLRSFGAPLVGFMKEAMRLGSRILDGLTWLNETLFGLPAYFVALTGGLIGLRAAINALSATFGALRSAGLFRPGGLTTALFGGRFSEDAERARYDREEERDRRDRRNRGWNTFAETAADAGMGAAAYKFMNRKVGEKADEFYDHLKSTFDVRWGDGAVGRGDTIKDWAESIFGAGAGFGAGRGFRRGRGRGSRFGLATRSEPNWRYHDSSARWKWWSDPEASDWRKEYGGWRNSNRYGFNNVSSSSTMRDWFDSKSMHDSGYPDWVTDAFVAAGVLNDPISERVKRRGRAGKGRHWWNTSNTAGRFREMGGGWADSAVHLGMRGGAAAGRTARSMSALVSANPAAAGGWLAALMGAAVIEGFMWWHKKLDATGLGDLSSTQVAMRAYMLRSNALSTLAGKDTSMRDVKVLGDIDVAAFKARALGAELDRADEDLRRMYREALSLSEGAGALPLRALAKMLSDRQMMDAQKEYSKNLWALAAKVKQMELMFPNREETRAWLAFFEMEKAKGGNWFQRLMRYVAQDSAFAEFLPDWMTVNPATQGPMEFHHLNATTEFMEKHGVALASQGIGVISDALKAQHAWAKDPQLRAALNYVDANRRADIDLKDALAAHYKIIQDRPGIKVEITVGTINEASLEDLTTSVEDSMKAAYRSWSDHNDGQIY